MSTGISSIHNLKIKSFINLFHLLFKDAVTANSSNHQQNQEIAGSSCDLSALDSLGNDSEDILRQLTENPFELDSFFTDFNTVDVKVSIWKKKCI